MGQAVMDWNRRYEENDTPWDKGEAHPVLRDMLAHDALSGRVLVPGCGSGHDVRELARHGLEVVGLDVAPLALERAPLLSVPYEESHPIDRCSAAHRFRGVRPLAAVRAPRDPRELSS